MTDSLAQGFADNFIFMIQALGMARAMLATQWLIGNVMAAVTAVMLFTLPLVIRARGASSAKTFPPGWEYTAARLWHAVSRFFIAHWVACYIIVYAGLIISFNVFPHLLDMPQQSQEFFDGTVQP